MTSTAEKELRLNHSILADMHTELSKGHVAPEREALLYTSIRILNRLIGEARAEGTRTSHHDDPQPSSIQPQRPS